MPLPYFGPDLVGSDTHPIDRLTTLREVAMQQPSLGVCRAFLIGISALLPRLREAGKAGKQPVGRENRNVKELGCYTAQKRLPATTTVLSSRQTTL